MDVRTCLSFCVLIESILSLTHDNVTLGPSSYLTQLSDFAQTNKRPGLLTSSAGEPVDVRSTLLLNTDQFTNQFHLDLHMAFAGERIPERMVHAKGTGAQGFFEVTNDVTDYTHADLFSDVGKKTPITVRFSTSIPSQSGSDLFREFKAMSIKFYTKEGNLDLLGLHTPIYFYKDPINFASLIHMSKRNPRTHLFDYTAQWDFVTLKPESFLSFFWLLSDLGVPNGYRKMDSFPIHVYELSNKKGEKHYIRFSFRSEQGLEILTNAQIAAIQSTDLDYYIRDMYNAIARKDYPAWRMEMDVLTLKDLKNIDYDPFDVTKVWKNGTYKTVPIGRIVLNRQPENHFRTIEQSAFNPGNLVPGIPGPVDIMFKARRLVYRDTQNYRLGRNHNKIEVNLPLYANTYNRDGVPPLRDNMADTPNYYPNSFNGPIPFVDENLPEKKLVVLQPNSIDLQAPADFYNIILTTEDQRQRLVDNLALTLATTPAKLRDRGLKFMYLIDQDLGKRVETRLTAALAANTTSTAI